MGAFIALAFLVVLLTFLVLGLLARVDTALDGVAMSGALRDGGLSDLSVGQSCPLEEFADSDLAQPLRFARSVVLFVAEGCAPCEILVAELVDHDLSAEGWTKLLVWDGQSSVAALPDWLITRRSSALRRLFQVHGTPFVVVVDDANRVAATGIPNHVHDLMRLVQRAANRSNEPHEAGSPQTGHSRPTPIPLLGRSRHE